MARYVPDRLFDARRSFVPGLSTWLDDRELEPDYHDGVHESALTPFFDPWIETFEEALEPPRFEPEGWSDRGSALIDKRVPIDLDDRLPTYDFAPLIPLRIGCRPWSEGAWTHVGFPGVEESLCGISVTRASFGLQSRPWDLDTDEIPDVCPCCLQAIMDGDLVQPPAVTMIGRHLATTDVAECLLPVWSPEPETVVVPWEQVASGPWWLAHCSCAPGQFTTSVIHVRMPRPGRYLGPIFAVTMAKSGFPGVKGRAIALDGDDLILEVLLKDLILRYHHPVDYPGTPAEYRSHLKRWYRKDYSLRDTQRRELVRAFRKAGYTDDEMAAWWFESSSAIAHAALSRRQRDLAAAAQQESQQRAREAVRERQDHEELMQLVGAASAEHDGERSSSPGDPSIMLRESSLA
jgi:hypothetical protein